MKRDRRGGLCASISPRAGVSRATVFRNSANAEISWTLRSSSWTSLMIDATGTSGIAGQFPDRGFDAQQAAPQRRQGIPSRARARLRAEIDGASVSFVLSPWPVSLSGIQNSSNAPATRTADAFSTSSLTNLRSVATYICRARPENGQYCSASRPVASDVLADKPDSIATQEVLSEFGVLLADIGKSAHHACAAEQLRLQAIPPSSQPHQIIDEQLHQVNAVLFTFHAGDFARLRQEGENDSFRPLPRGDRAGKPPRRSRVASHRPFQERH